MHTPSSVFRAALCGVPTSGAVSWPATRSAVLEFLPVVYVGGETEVMLLIEGLKKIELALSREVFDVYDNARDHNQMSNDAVEGFAAWIDIAAVVGCTVESVPQMEAWDRWWGPGGWRRLAAPLLKGITEEALTRLAFHFPKPPVAPEHFLDAVLSEEAAIREALQHLKNGISSDCHGGVDNISGIVLRAWSDGVTDIFVDRYNDTTSVRSASEQQRLLYLATACGAFVTEHHERFAAASLENYTVPCSRMLTNDAIMGRWLATECALIESICFEQPDAVESIRLRLLEDEGSRTDWRREQLDRALHAERLPAAGGLPYSNRLALPVRELPPLLMAAIDRLRPVLCVYSTGDPDVSRVAWRRALHRIFIPALQRLCAILEDVVLELHAAAKDTRSGEAVNPLVCRWARVTGTLDYVLREFEGSVVPALVAAAYHLPPTAPCPPPVAGAVTDEALDEVLDTLVVMRDAALREIVLLLSKGSVTGNAGLLLNISRMLSPESHDRLVAATTGDAPT